MFVCSSMGQISVETFLVPISFYLGKCLYVTLPKTHLNIYFVTENGFHDRCVFGRLSSHLRQFTVQHTTRITGK